MVTKIVKKKEKKNSVRVSLHEVRERERKKNCLTKRKKNMLF